MQITVSLELTTQLRPNLWLATLDPAQTLEVGPPLAQRGDVSIILVSDAAHDAETGRLNFPLSTASVLNLGQTNQAVIVSDGVSLSKVEKSQTVTTDDSMPRPAINLKSGDSECLRSLSALPKDIFQIGQKIVERIREIDSSGELKLEGKRYINRSDNFITIQPQFRLGDLLITVRGYVNVELPAASAIPGYSAFKINRRDQLAQALRLVNEAKRRGS
jgi:hypothetical protein